MKDLTPVPLSDTGLQLMEPMTNSHAPSGPKLSVHKLLFFLRRFWWIPIITLTLSGSAAVFMFLHKPPIFVAAGRMWETEKLQLPDGASFADNRDNYIGTLTELLQSKKMWDLTTNYMAVTDPKNIVLGKDGNMVPVDIQVFASPKSSVYTIVASGANPAFTPAYLNDLMDQYIAYRLDVRDEVSAHTLSSISTQIESYEEDVKSAQIALNDYERSNNFAVLQEASIVDAQYLSKLKTELSDYQLQMNLLAARELESNSGLAGGTNSSDEIFDSLSGSGSQDSFVSHRVEAEQQIELLKMQRDRLAKNLRPTHPKMVKLDEDIARSEKLIEVYRQQNHEQIAAARQALQIRIDNVKQFIKEWETKVAAEVLLIAQVDALRQDVSIKQRMADRLAALNDNVEVSQHIDQDTLAVLDKATSSSRSYAEAKAMMSQSVVMGLGLGLGIILLLAWRDDRFGTLVEVSEKFGDSVVGQVPEVPMISGKNPLTLLECNDDRYMYAESYRNLRSALLFLAIEGHRPRTLLITSAVPDEGKSTVATNLARALAMGGSRVLLVDGDLRKGHIHDLLNLQPEPGFSDLLVQPDEPERFIQATDLPNFAFLSRGGIRRNPGDLFLNPVFDQIIARFREQYDYVLIDSSPVFAADDTSTIAPRVDGTLFVVRSHFSHARVVREALELLFQRQARVLGLVLNRSDPTARNYHFYKYAKYYSQGNTVEADVVS